MLDVQSGETGKKIISQLITTYSGKTYKYFIRDLEYK